MLRSLEVNLSVAILQKVLFDCIFTMVLHCRLILEIAIEPLGTLLLIARFPYFMFVIQSSKCNQIVWFFADINQTKTQVILNTAINLESLCFLARFFFISEAILGGGEVHNKNPRNCLHCPHSTSLNPTGPPSTLFSKILLSFLFYALLYASLSNKCTHTHTHTHTHSWQTVWS